MLDTQSAQVIPYGQGQSVTVYGDCVNPKTYYIMPHPVLPTDAGGGPRLYLTEFRSPAGPAATCILPVELDLPPEAVTAVHQRLGRGITLGQPDWFQTVAWLIPRTGPRSRVLAAKPSHLDCSTLTFTFTLEDRAEVALLRSTLACADGRGEARLACSTFDGSILWMLRLSPVPRPAVHEPLWVQSLDDAHDDTLSSW